MTETKFHPYNQLLTKNENSKSGRLWRPFDALNSEGSECSGDKGVVANTSLETITLFSSPTSSWPSKQSDFGG